MRNLFFSFYNLYGLVKQPEEVCENLEPSLQTKPIAKIANTHKIVNNLFSKQRGAAQYNFDEQLPYF